MATVIVPQPGATSNGSAAITTGGTAQQIFAANASRKFFFFQNISDTAMWLNFGVAAVADQPSIQVAAGAIYREDMCCASEYISVICATTGKKFVAKQR